MGNINLLNIPSSASSIEGTPQTMHGSQVTIHIFATSYGGDGKIVLKSSSDGINFDTLEDDKQPSGLAEYSENIIFPVNRLPQGWSIRADLVVTSGTVTGLNVIMGG